MAKKNGSTSDLMIRHDRTFNAWPLQCGQKDRRCQGAVNASLLVIPKQCFRGSELPNGAHKENFGTSWGGVGCVDFPEMGSSYEWDKEYCACDDKASTFCPQREAICGHSAGYMKVLKGHGAITKTTRP